MIIRESVRKMEDIKYFTKQILIEYNNAAIREKRNRAIEEQFLESLQEGVLYPIVFKMYHTKDEIRVQIDFFENRTAFLDMTVEEALTFFENVPQIKRKVETLYNVGLSYIKLGQPSTTLSGGEAQRIKLATELSKRSTGKTIYILDEPTTGLHTADVRKLIEILQKLAEGGNTVLVIEHNLDVIKTADYIIDMGPEGGDGGGTVIAQGTPEEICEVKQSYTGRFLTQYLEKAKDKL